MSKRLVGFGMALWCAALVAGCQSSKSSKSSQATVYSEPGGTYSAKSSQPTTYSQSAGGTSSVYWQQQGTAGSTSSAQSSNSAASSAGQVSIPLYEEQIVVGMRPVETGAVRLRKQVTTETVNQPVQIRRETLVVDREAAPEGQTSLKEAGIGATAGTSGGIMTPFEQGEIVIKLHREEPVIEKRIVSTGRIIAQTRTNTEQTTVQREVRKEKIDVEKIGNPENVTISEKVSDKSKNEAVGGTGTGSEQTKGQKAQDNQKQQDSQKSQDNQKPQDNPKQQDDKTPGEP
ncbi:MAG TPA: YsnF/AvaK domain-containing protein [Candidatus Binatia bacterium]|nr:YsnF/AvaK domain-containing protein [Candidatus Binatia bacterium]